MKAGSQQLIIMLLKLITLLQNEFIDSEEEDEDGGDEDIQWLAYKEVSDMNGKKNFVSYNKPKIVAGR